MLSVAIDLCKNVMDFISKKKEMKQDTKFRISILLDEISGVLLDTVSKFEEDKYPHFNCAILEKMIDHLHFYLIDYLPQEQVDELRETLINSMKVEESFAKRHEENTIAYLKEAAGEFKAMSLLLKL